MINGLDNSTRGARQLDLWRFIILFMCHNISCSPINVTDI